MRHSPLLLLFALLALGFSLPHGASAQEVKNQPTPFSVWLDFKALSSANPPKVSLPIWLESLQSDAVEGDGGRIAKTVFRLRFRPLGALNRELLLRLIFDDIPGHAPTITAWSTTGAPLLEQGPLGGGLNLPTSSTFTIAMTDVSTIDIAVAGDGGNIRGTYLSSLRRGEMRYPLDFATPPDTTDGFNNLPSIPPPSEDTLLMGRLRATIDPGLVSLTPREVTKQVWEFDLAAAPLLATVSFEILNADPLSPLEIVVNDQPLGVTTMRVPDLADPAFQGVLRPLDRGVRFRYAGWLQCQKAIPGSALRAGTNRIELRLPAESGPVAVRSVDLQLRSEWQNLDFNVAPANP